MKVFVGLLFIALIGFCAFNYMQVQDLKQQVARLEIKLNEEQQQGVSDRVVAEATRALIKAHDAISQMDPATARTYVENARVALERAGRAANEKAGPTMRWLGEQASALGKKVQDKVNPKH